MSDEMYKAMFQDTIRALAAIDTALGMPDDGCNSPERTITAIKLLHSAHKDDVAEIERLREQTRGMAHIGISTEAELIRLRGLLREARGEMVDWLIENRPDLVARIDAALAGAAVQPSPQSPCGGREMRSDLNWFDRLLCRLGLHRWMTDTRYMFRDPPVPAFCYRCHKKRGGYGE